MKISTQIILVSSLCVSVFLTAPAFAQKITPKNTYHTKGTGTGSGQTVAKAQADCGEGTLLGGGGSCKTNNGLVGIASNHPSGNHWLVACQSNNEELVTATAFAICMGSNPQTKTSVEITASNRF